MSSNIYYSLKKKLILQMKAKESDNVTISRLIINEMNMQCLNSGVPSPISDEEATKVLLRMAKQRKDSISQFKDAARLDLAQKEEAQLEIITKLLPQQLSESETKDLVVKIISEKNIIKSSEMGIIMKDINNMPAGTIDKSLVIKIIKQIL